MLPFPNSLPLKAAHRPSAADERPTQRGAQETSLSSLVRFATCESSVFISYASENAPAARRMAELLGEEVGETVGYHIRHERCASARTRVEAAALILAPTDCCARSSASPSRSSRCSIRSGVS